MVFSPKMFSLRVSRVANDTVTLWVNIDTASLEMKWIRKSSPILMKFGGMKLRKKARHGGRD